MQADSTIEEWRVIPDFPLYSASSLGRIRSNPRILKPCLNRHGYRQLWVSTERGSRPLTRRVHQLVANAFLPPKPSPRHQVDHSDSDRANNKPGNLEWVTCQENMRRARAKGHLYDTRGENHGKSVLTDSDVLAIRTACATQQSLALQYGVARATISDVLRRRTWKHV